MNSIYRRFALTLVGAVVSICAAHNASAETILRFSRQTLSSEFSISTSDLATYGDRVTSPIQGPSNFKYGGAANTPNIVVDYGSDDSIWTSNFADLTSVLYTRGLPFNDGIIKVTLTADPGYFVRLNGFDLGGWSQTDYITKSVKIYDNADQLVFDQSNVLVHGDAVGPTHTSLAFSSLISQRLRLEIDASNITASFGAENVGLDNLSFSQVAAVPEPASIGFGLLVVFGIGCIRTCRTRPNVIK